MEWPDSITQKARFNLLFDPQTSGGLLAGISAVMVALIHAFTLKFEYKIKRKNRFELVVHFWHFVDILWIYLLFFLLNH